MTLSDVRSPFQGPEGLVGPLVEIPQADNCLQLAGFFFFNSSQGQITTELLVRPTEDSLKRLLVGYPCHMDGSGVLAGFLTGMKLHWHNVLKGNGEANCKGIMIPFLALK